MARNSEYQSSDFLCRLKELMEEVETLKAERAVIESELKNTNPDMQSTFLSAAASGSLNEPYISLASLGRTSGPLQHQVGALFFARLFYFNCWRKRCHGELLVKMLRFKTSSRSTFSSNPRSSPTTRWLPSWSPRPSRWSGPPTSLPTTSR